MRVNTLAGLQRWQKFVLIYAVLLFLSHFTLWITKKTVKNNNGPSKEVTVQVVEADQSISKQEIRIPYQDIYKGESSNPQTLLLLPGGMDGPDVFNDLIPQLALHYRILVPHLPGFNKSREELPDYSFKTLSIYTNQFLNALGISNVNVVGYGLGGANAINMAHSYPDKINSMILISSIGVQELELLGSYRLNHIVHGVQLGGVWLLYNSIPHFGMLDLFNLDVSYAKSHYESDQRPLRGYLKQYKKPMLILHGRDDPLVPLAAAKEHYRIVPQSKLQVFDADHDLIESHADSVALSLKSFLTDLKKGKAVVAGNASPERIKNAQKEFSNIEFAKFKGASLFVLMLIIVLGTLISEDLTCIGAGLLAARGLIGFWPATLACFVGIFIGDVGLYLVGRFMGRPAVGKIPFRWMVSEQDLEKSAKWFRTKGPAIIIASRFLPGSRMPTYFSAGVLKAGFWRFLFFFLFASIIWTPMLVGISQLLGNELLRYFSLYKDYALWVFLGALFLLLIIAKVIIPLFSYKGRRLLVSTYCKFTRWEYWPSFVLYTPVVVYVIYLGLKYRCLTLFTAANPSIPDSGFIGESKADILGLFNKEDVAPYSCISYDCEWQNMFEEAELFMSDKALDFPIVLKPNIGQRGKGVAIIRDREAMKTYFKQSSGAVIIQKYISGKEFGIFYYRMPNDSEGKIFSITKKQLISLTGDGQKTIQELILANEQTISLAKLHLKNNEERLFDVPAEGENVQVVDVGTHARGAIFYDGSELITDKLRTRINEICTEASGYYFGRFDIKAPSEDHLKAGKELTIIEVNGVTSESTNIYDADNSFIDAQKILFRQWRLAFEIGAQNRQRNAPVSPVLPFIKRMVGRISR